MKTKRADYAVIGVVVIALAAIYIFAIQAETGNPQSPTVMTCTDTDGTDTSTKGTVTYTVNGAESVFTDECSGDILKEYTCNGDRIASRLQKCSCIDGRCA